MFRTNVCWPHQGLELLKISRANFAPPLCCCLPNAISLGWTSTSSASTFLACLNHSKVWALFLAHVELRRISAIRVWKLTLQVRSRLLTSMFSLATISAVTFVLCSLRHNRRDVRSVRVTDRALRAVRDPEEDSRVGHRRLHQVPHVCRVRDIRPCPHTGTYHNVGFSFLWDGSVICPK